MTFFFPRLPPACEPLPTAEPLPLAVHAQPGVPSLYEASGLSWR